MYLSKCQMSVRSVPERPWSWLANSLRVSDMTWSKHNTIHHHHILLPCRRKITWHGRKGTVYWQRVKTVEGLSANKGWKMNWGGKNTDANFVISNPVFGIPLPGKCDDAECFQRPVHFFYFFSSFFSQLHHFVKKLGFRKANKKKQKKGGQLLLWVFPYRQALSWRTSCFTSQLRHRSIILLLLLFVVVGEA